MGLSGVSCFFYALALFNILLLVCTADPSPLQDYCVASTPQTVFLNGLTCKNPGSVVVSDFLSSLLSQPGNVSNPLGVAVTLAAAATFPGLNTQGLSIARIDFAKDGFVPPHVHPRASELLLVTEGVQTVGFIDTSNKLFTTTVKAGELFLFPQGLIHFQLEAEYCTGSAFATFNSQNPGLSLVATALFGSTPSIPDVILQKTFQITAQEVEQIKKAFGH